MTTPIRILVADDHPIFREGVKAILSMYEDMDLVGMAANGEDAIEFYRRLRPDVVLMDLQMPGIGGLNAIYGITKEFPSANVIALTTYQGDAQIRRAFKAGAASYLMKSALRGDLILTIRQVFGGERPLHTDVATVINQHAGGDRLSAREIEVLRHVAIGFSNKRIAARMGISLETVKTHMRSILMKVKAKDRAEAVVTALRRGIIDS